MMRSRLRLAFVLSVLTVFPSVSLADVAVLVKLSSNGVTIERVQRSEPSELERSQEAIRKQALTQQLQTREQLGSALELHVRWIDRAGQLVHRSVHRDPRYVHAPGNDTIELPEAVLLLRGPSSAVQLLIRANGSTNFLAFDV